LKENPKYLNWLQVGIMTYKVGELMKHKGAPVGPRRKKKTLNKVVFNLKVSGKFTKSRQGKVKSGSKWLSV